MFELNKVYGFKKFVVVVPSVAIREGTMKNLQITRSHFAADYANVPCVPILYDSTKLTDLRHFAQSDALSVLVINIDSFTKDNNKINQKGERAFAPIEYIKAVNPIVIVDEPQNFETDVRRRALADLNPLCTLRYSATHKNPYNLLYSLNPVQAYDLGLVKQIEVDGVLADDDQNQAFVELLSIDAKPKSLTCKMRLDVNEPSGVKRKEITLKLGDDLYAKSKERDAYQEGYILNEIAKTGKAPRLAVGTHFQAEDDTIVPAMADIRSWYSGPFTVASDFMVIDVTRDAVTPMRAVVSDYAWNPPPADPRSGYTDDPKYKDTRTVNPYAPMAPLAQFDPWLLAHVIPPCFYDPEDLSCVTPYPPPYKSQ